ncbi:uncharacterized protein LOC143257317 isoform X2 [Tachypleus tridentatus]|uniref:uncharacterized protein LOC143257317 isoform X2 n=1 Tax=Tachypleus tridentatus TaxID=6853 RepID=UPI003FD0D142
MHKSQRPDNGSSSNNTEATDKPSVSQSVTSFKEDTDFLNLLQKMKKFNSFAEWEESRKETFERRKKTKEKLPPRPKPLTKKEEKAQSYRRTKEAKKLYEELMQQQQQQRMKEEKRLQKEAKRCDRLKEEKLDHFQERASLAIRESEKKNTSAIKQVLSSKTDEEVDQETAVKHLQNMERKINMQECQEIKTFGADNGTMRMMNHCRSRQKSKEWNTNSCPSSGQDQLTKKKQNRYEKPEKMNKWREPENNTVSTGRMNEPEEVDLKDYQAKRNEKFRKYETAEPKAPCPNINIWEERKAKQDAIQKLIPSSTEDEEAMLLKAVELSRAQLVKDKQLRIAKLKLMNTEVTSSSETPDVSRESEKERHSVPCGGSGLSDTKSEIELDQLVKSPYFSSDTEILKVEKQKDEGKCELEEKLDNVSVPSFLTHEVSKMKSGELEKQKTEKLPGFVNERKDECLMRLSNPPNALKSCQTYNCKLYNVKKISKALDHSDIKPISRNVQLMKLSNNDSSSDKQVNCVSKENQISFDFQKSLYSAGTTSDLPTDTESEHISVSTTLEPRETVHKNSVQFTDDGNILQENVSDRIRTLPRLHPNEQPFQHTYSPVQSNSVDVATCNLPSPIMTINNKQTVFHTHHTNEPKMMTPDFEFSNNQTETCQLSVANVSQPYPPDQRLLNSVSDVSRKDLEQPLQVSSSVISQLLHTNQKIKDSLSQASDALVGMAVEESSDVPLGRVTQPFIKDPTIQNPYPQQNENQVTQELSTQSDYAVANNYCNPGPQVLTKSVLPPATELEIPTETNPGVAGSPGLFLLPDNSRTLRLLQQQATYIQNLQYQLYLQSLPKNPFFSYALPHLSAPSLPVSFYSPLLNGSQVLDNHHLIISSHPPASMYPTNHNTEFCVSKSEDHQLSNRTNVSTALLPPEFNFSNDYLLNNTSHQDNPTQRNTRSGVHLQVASPETCLQDHHHKNIASPSILRNKCGQLKGSGRARTFRRVTGEPRQMRIPGYSNINSPFNNNRCCDPNPIQNPRNDDEQNHLCASRTANTSQLEPSRKNPAEEGSQRANVLQMQALNASFPQPRNPRHFGRWKKEQEVIFGVLPSPE